MARRRYRKYYKRSKGRWSANIRSVINSTVTAANGNFYGSLVLATNPAQNTSTVSQQYTVKNIEFSFQIETTDANQTFRNGVESLCAFIMYVPQGMTVTTDYITQHPEYIMAHRFLGSPDIELPNTSETPTQVFRNPLKIKTRMARRLQTGDSIIWLITGNNSSGIGNINLNVNGLIRWWTKAN